MKVAVVGAGIVGVSAARELAARGHGVTLYEQFAVGHRRGSSHGRSRIVRRAYPDPFFTKIMGEAYPVWAEIEAAAETRLVHEVGLAYVGDANAPRVRGVAEGLEAVGVPHIIFDTNHSMLGDLHVQPGEIAIFTPEAGWVAADEAVRVIAELGVRAGVDLREHAAGDPRKLVNEFDAVVLTAGAWVRRWVDLPVTVTRQTIAYVQAHVLGPVWIDDGPLTYGFPSDTFGQKIGAHVPGAEVDPDVGAGEPDPVQLNVIAETAGRRFGIVAPKLAEASTCLYTSTADEDFRWGRFGANGFYASACSGHGFKTGPWVGRKLADFVDGSDRPESIERFCRTGSGSGTSEFDVC